VDVLSDGQDQGTGSSCGGTSYVGSVRAGSQWQCTELVNRLYLTRGWISARWPGNGGRSAPGTRDSLYDEAPASLAKELNGSISYVAPGDVVSVNVYHGSAFQSDGYVLIVSTVAGASITLISQNGGVPCSATVTTRATLSGGTLTIPDLGTWSYSVIGVVHAPIALPPAPPLAPAHLRDDGEPA
jgi:hypothetical protein